MTPALKPTVHTCINIMSHFYLKTGLHQTVLVDFATAPRKLALSPPHSGHLLAVFLYMCLSSCYVLYIHTLLSFSGSLAQPQEVFYLVRFGQNVLIFPFLNPPPASLSVFLLLQDNLRQLIMIPLPNVLLLGRTPYCGMLF